MLRESRSVFETPTYHRLLCSYIHVVRPGGIGRYDFFRRLQRRQCWGRNARNLGSRSWNLGCLQRRLRRYRLAP